MKGKIYLVPNTLGNPETMATHPPLIARILSQTTVFIVEDLRNARRYLKRMNRDILIDQLVFYELNKHSSEQELPAYLEPLEDGKDIALLSEAGVPGVADPGAAIVRMAHERNIRVIPLTGPSSILLGLMASGLNGQCFCFHGYLPVKRAERIQRIRELEQSAFRKDETQIFIETPYRNDSLLTDILVHCRPDTRLCIAADISLETEFIRTRSMAEWKKEKPALHKRPVVFLIGK